MRRTMSRHRKVSLRQRWVVLALLCFAVQLKVAHCSRVQTRRKAESTDEIGNTTATTEDFGNSTWSSNSSSTEMDGQSGENATSLEELTVEKKADVQGLFDRTDMTGEDDTEQDSLLNKTATEELDVHNATMDNDNGTNRTQVSASDALENFNYSDGENGTTHSLNATDDTQESVSSSERNTTSSGDGNEGTTSVNAEEPASAENATSIYASVNSTVPQGDLGNSSIPTVIDTADASLTTESTNATNTEITPGNGTSDAAELQVEQNDTFNASENDETLTTTPINYPTDAHTNASTSTLDSSQLVGTISPTPAPESNTQGDAIVPTTSGYAPYSSSNSVKVFSPPWQTQDQTTAVTQVMNPAWKEANQGENQLMTPAWEQSADATDQEPVYESGPYNSTAGQKVTQQLLETEPPETLDPIQTAQPEDTLEPTQSPLPYTGVSSPTKIGNGTTATVLQNSTSQVVNDTQSLETDSYVLPSSTQQVFSPPWVEDKDSTASETQIMNPSWMENTQTNSTDDNTQPNSTEAKIMNPSWMDNTQSNSTGNETESALTDPVWLYDASTSNESESQPYFESTKSNGFSTVPTSGWSASPSNDAAGGSSSGENEFVGEGSEEQETASGSGSRMSGITYGQVPYLPSWSSSSTENWNAWSGSGGSKKGPKGAPIGSSDCYDGTPTKSSKVKKKEKCNGYQPKASKRKIHKEPIHYPHYPTSIPKSPSGILSPVSAPSTISTGPSLYFPTETPNQMVPTPILPPSSRTELPYTTPPTQHTTTSPGTPSPATSNPIPSSPVSHYPTPKVSPNPASLNPVAVPSAATPVTTPPTSSSPAAVVPTTSAPPITEAPAAMPASSSPAVASTPSTPPLGTLSPSGSGGTNPPTPLLSSSPAAPSAVQTPSASSLPLSVAPSTAIPTGSSPISIVSSVPTPAISPPPATPTATTLAPSGSSPTSTVSVVPTPQASFSPVTGSPVTGPPASTSVPSGSSPSSASVTPTPLLSTSPVAPTAATGPTTSALPSTLSPSLVSVAPAAPSTTAGPSTIAPPPSTASPGSANPVATPSSTTSTPTVSSSVQATTAVPTGTAQQAEIKEVRTLASPVTVEATGSIDLATAKEVFFNVTMGVMQEYLNSYLGPVLEEFNMKITFQKSQTTLLPAGATGTTVLVNSYFVLDMDFKLSSDNIEILQAFTQRRATDLIKGFFNDIPRNKLLSQLNAVGITLASIQVVDEVPTLDSGGQTATDGNYNSTSAGDGSDSQHIGSQPGEQSGSKTALYAGVASAGVVVVAIAALAYSRHRHNQRWFNNATESVLESLYSDGRGPPDGKVLPVLTPNATSTTKTTKSSSLGSHSTRSRIKPAAITLRKKQAIKSQGSVSTLGSFNVTLNPVLENLGVEGDGDSEAKEDEDVALMRLENGPDLVAGSELTRLDKNYSHPEYDAYSAAQRAQNSTWSVDGVTLEEDEEAEAIIEQARRRRWQEDGYDSALASLPDHRSELGYHDGSAYSTSSRNSLGPID